MLMVQSYQDFNWSQGENDRLYMYIVIIIDCDETSFVKVTSDLVDISMDKNWVTGVGCDFVINGGRLIVWRGSIGVR